MTPSISRKRYDSDITDDEWPWVAPLVAQAVGPGRKRSLDIREVINALFYFLRTGCQWRNIPHEFPNHNSVRYYFDKWTYDGTWIRINDALRQAARQRDERQAQPSAGIVDSQSVKTTEAGGRRGYDAGKKVNGRTRHLSVDTQGYLLRVLVQSADVQDRDGARPLLEILHQCFPRLSKLWMDGGYAGELENWAHETLGLSLEIVRKLADQRGFVVLPRRWVVERTIAWINRNRRLSKDYEHHEMCSESLIYLASIRLLLRRLAKAA